MRVLVACEFSGVVRDAFRRRGHEAWSCDVAEPLTESRWHIRADVRLVLREHWDLVIAHPPCTRLTVAGARWFKGRETEQQEAAEFFRMFAGCAEKVCIENPIGVMSRLYRKPDQIVQPWQFGHGETKATCLWLEGLPKLASTNIVAGRVPRVHYESPGIKNGLTRQQRRSVTYQGIADAMAEQWGSTLSPALNSPVVAASSLVGMGEGERAIATGASPDGSGVGVPLVGVRGADPCAIGGAVAVQEEGEQENEGHGDEGHGDRVCDAGRGVRKNYEILQGDVLAMLAALADESVHCVVTSPPYWGLRDYGCAGQIGREATPAEFVAKLVAVFREVRRVLRKDGTMFLNLGDSYASGGKHPSQSPRRPDVPPYDTSGTTPSDFSALDSACSDLCDGCAGVLLQGTSGSDLSPHESQRHASRKGRDNEPTDCETAPQLDVLHDVLESTTREPSQPQEGMCSHCRVCMACLAVLRSSSRDADLCVRRGAYKRGTSRSGSAESNQGMASLDSAFVYSTTASLIRPKDLMGMPWRLAFALQEDGWWLRQDIIWAKPNCMPGSQIDRCTSSHEYIFMLTKAATYWSDFDAIKTPPRESSLARLAQDVQAQAGSHRANGGAKTNGPMKAVGMKALPENQSNIRAARDKQRGHSRQHAGFNDRWDAREKAEQHSKPAMMRDVWFVSPASYSEAHFAVMPEEIARRCILAGCPEGGTVLDPFSGSGTTGLVALANRCQYIGIELNPEYVAMSERRLADASSQGSLYFAAHSVAFTPKGTDVTAGEVAQ